MDLSEVDRRIAEVMPRGADPRHVYSCHRYDRLTQALGAFVMKWSQLENFLAFPLFVSFDALRKPHVQKSVLSMLYSLNSTEAKIALVKSAVDNMPDSEERKRKMQNALRRIPELCKERNRLCHHVWTLNLDAEQFVLMNHRAHGSTREVGQKVTAEEIDKLSLQTIACAQDLVDACGRSDLAITEDRLKTTLGL